MIIDDVIANVRQDFEDMGIEKEVLDELQRSWEQKIVSTGVADFEGAAPIQPKSRKQKEGSSTTTGESSSQATKGENGENKDVIVKKEDDEGNSNKVARTNGSSNVHSENAKGEQQATFANGSNPHQSANINGLLDDTGAGSSNSANKRKRPAADDNEIGSDLDDSDEDEMEGNVDADGNEDMILCLYDKVQRVRNKWKCVLRDGVASIDGRDYVFSKLSSELEW
ncbi:TFIIA-domain-containing protein [Meira miltonrushii]|uniref:TFIIA-domain-containing protein n=1 Tax=Meira miltonrushii TaxID=1280837 RepID=A0A316V4M5_9BASI|nr:TFIIA-domain-containing protein [Meira miltonrushii]PWN32497.1 TFIIA-domain-containing protein [Meira miltonrushii]